MVFLIARPSRWAVLRIQSVSNSAKGQTMIDRDVKELFIDFAAIVILTVAIVYFRQ
jgi:hypothetical protein